MPAWLSLILWNIVLPDLITWLRKDGHINAAESLAARGAVSLINDVKSIKKYAAPTDFPHPPPQDTGTTTSNNLS